ncbi:NADH:flavin oxidoreductase [Pedobacter yulinensis]|uniref:NADH:flavin oxidoreductase n=1 Tax=Pedobacter yulinensis TaxID=2126353 RepID=A0A2T3HJK0_9SPHI|nr:NADH:flavin oxidoreductase [Pedobacter yulinensis]PST82561.1 NADH:flavin oxidoreductase [Pedobacter yulinensis]
MKNSVLFSPVTLGNLTLKNRFTVAPMTRRSASADGVPGRKMQAYYSAFAAGGFAMIITEGIYTDDAYSQADENQPGLINQAQMEGWKAIATSVKQHGTLFIAQLMHAGALSQCREETVAPSAVQPVGLRATEPGGPTGPFPMPRAMDAADFETVKAGYVTAARLAVAAGFDGLELHAANGYLFDQFITPHTNRRQDAYGGDEASRLRFLVEVFEAIKAAVPAEFLIGIRMSESKVNDLTYRWPGGAETATALFKALSHVPAAYFHLAAEGGKWARECLYTDGRSSNGIARQLTGKPVIANGGMHDPELAHALIAGEQADLVAVGRGAIANPDLPNRLMTCGTLKPFFKELIQPSLTLAHTAAVLTRRKTGQSGGWLSEQAASSKEH